MTLIELITALALGLFVLSSVYSIFAESQRFYRSNIAGANFQRNANLLMSKIIKGKREPGGIFRLSEAASYNLVSIGELHFVGTDGIERWYWVNGSGTSVTYHHPTFNGVQNEVIYTAPAGAVITLRFWIPTGAVYSNICVGIDAAIAQMILGKPVTGSATTMINLRNHAA